MALTQPFFNSISAFDATNSRNLYLNVLGGDAITRINYNIYENISGNLVYSGFRTVTGDTTSQSIRSFPITLQANVLQNNYEYKITATTQNSSSTSSASEYQVFACYVAPSFAIMRYDGSNMQNITSSYVVPSTALTTYIGFLKNDASSPAVLRSATYNLLGVNSLGNSALIMSGTAKGSEVTIGAPTTTTDFNVSLSSFAPTQDSLGNDLADAPFESYTIEISGETVDGMNFQTQVTGLECYYSTSSADNALTLTNKCSNGAINIDVNYTDDISDVVSYALQYKEIGDADWVTLIGSADGTTPYVFTPQFNFDFFYCGNCRLYEFRLMLFNSDDSVITATAQIYSNFHKSFVCDANNSYNITSEWGVGSYSTSNENAVYGPFNSRYPYVVKNARQLYRSGAYTCVLLAPTSMTSSELDRYAQLNLKQGFENWLANGGAKIIKTLNGDLYVCSITQAISSDYYKELANGLASSNFSWTEVGDIKTDLPRLGLTNNFVIN